MPVIVNDGFSNSAPFNASVEVTPVNDPPAITGQLPLSTPEDVSIALTLASLVVSDPDNVYPDEFTLSVAEGTNYTVDPLTNIVTPTMDFNGDLVVPVTVSDGAAPSAAFMLGISVTAENDPPALTGPIEGQQAVENSPFFVDVSPNFSDPDSILRFSADGLPVSGNLSIDPDTGLLSGTPVEADAQDFPYSVTVTASDGELSISTSFDLIVAALDRANVGPVSRSRTCASAPRRRDPVQLYGEQCRAAAGRQHRTRR